MLLRLSVASLVCGGQFEADDACYDEPQAGDAPRARCLSEEDNSKDGRTNRAHTYPNSVGSADRKRLHGNAQ